MIHQKVLGKHLEGWTYDYKEGPSFDVGDGADMELAFDIEDFVHMLVLGGTTSGKGVFCSTFLSYMNENYKFKCVDFNDPTDFENGYYGWPQDNEVMLARFEDTFFENTPHGFDFEMYFPHGTLEEGPDFFTPFSLGLWDLSAQDFRALTRMSDDEVMEVDDLMYSIETTEEFIKKCPKKALKIMLQRLIGAGVIGEETTLDFKRLNDYKIFHSFTMSGVSNPKFKAFLEQATLRIMGDERAGKGRHDALWYLREASTLPDELFKTLATRIRHRGVHLIADTQRAMAMIDKTGRGQFSSQAIFSMRYETGEQVLKEFGIKTGYARGLDTANRGVGLLRFNGGSHPLFPVAISPPVCAYKSSNANYLNDCRTRGAHVIRYT